MKSARYPFLILLLFSLQLAIFHSCQLTASSIDERQEPDFFKLLEDLSLSFQMPEGFEPTPTRENHDLFYNYAIKLPTDSFEVRYSVFPLAPLMERYQESLSDSNTLMINPNKIHPSSFQANILNVSQSGTEAMPNIQYFHPSSVKKEFGADAGGSSFFNPNSDFGKNYGLCSMVMLHKENIADVYISF
ncbi:MAG: hypothetical protein AAGC85_20145, partial [Bacteroidota bacterium]